MIINFVPQRRDDVLSVSVRGDAITLNGVELDFSPLEEGATLPASAVDNEFVVGDVERVDGDIEITILLPHGANPSQEVAFPKPIVVAVDGDVELPQ